MSGRARGLALAAALSCLAAAPGPRPAEEARARALFEEIRCVVCQNESIASSQAEIAGDLRQVVREQVAAGRTNEEIRAYLVGRYGEFVMFRPAFSFGNAALWLLPFAIAAGGLAAIGLRARRAPPADPLTPEEAGRLSALQHSEPNNQNVT